MRRSEVVAHEAAVTPAALMAALQMIDENYGHIVLLPIKFRWKILFIRIRPSINITVHKVIVALMRLLDQFVDAEPVQPDILVDNGETL